MLHPDDKAQESPEAIESEAASSATLAHELSNLLDGSLRNLELVMSRLRGSTQRNESSTASGDEDLLRKLQAADQAMRQMATIVRRWMGGSHISLDVYQERWSLAETIEHAQFLLTPLLQERQIKLLIDIDPQVQHLTAGPIYPVVMNGLRNSIEAMDLSESISIASRCIELTLGREDQWIVLSITDTGRGIDAQLFDEDDSFRYGSTTKAEGHGLGLLLSQQIAESIGGTLELASRKPRGTVLTMRYPVPTDSSQRISDPQ